MLVLLACQELFMLVMPHRPVDPERVKRSPGHGQHAQLLIHADKHLLRHPPASRGGILPSTEGGGVGGTLCCRTLRFRYKADWAGVADVPDWVRYTRQQVAEAVLATAKLRPAEHAAQKSKALGKASAAPAPR